MTAPTADPKRLAQARKQLAEHGVDVLFEDHLLLGICKGSGVLSQPGPEGEGSLVELIDQYRREAEGKAGRAFVGLVHRLDRNVSGAMVVAKSSKAAARLSAAFRSRTGVEKRYFAWTRESCAFAGTLTLVSLVERDREGRTTFEYPAPREGASLARLVIEETVIGSGGSRVLMRLDTGFTHQIRVQLSGKGGPIFGDVKYGGPRAPRAARLDRDRLALHAWRLTVPHPIGGAPVTIEAPVPADLRRLDRALEIAPPLA